MAIAATIQPLPAAVPPPPADDPTALADLLQQTRMAEAAEQMIGLGYAQLGLTLLGTLGLFLTIFLTYRSVRASERGLADARSHATAQLRAYVRILLSELDATEDGGAIIRVASENTGQTPAQAYELRIAVYAGRLRDPVLAAATAPNAAIQIAAGQTQITGIQVGADDLVDFREGRSPLNVVGHATYQDVFGIVRETGFAYRLTLGSPHAHNHEVGNFWT